MYGQVRLCTELSLHRIIFAVLSFQTVVVAQHYLYKESSLKRVIIAKNHIKVLIYVHSKKNHVCREVTLLGHLSTGTTLHRNNFAQEPIYRGTNFLRNHLAQKPVCKGTALHRPIGSSEHIFAFIGFYFYRVLLTQI